MCCIYSAYFKGPNLLLIITMRRLTTDSLIFFDSNKNYCNSDLVHFILLSDSRQSVLMFAKGSHEKHVITR